MSKVGRQKKRKVIRDQKVEEVVHSLDGGLFCDNCLKLVYFDGVYYCHSFDKDYDLCGGFATVNGRHNAS